MMNKLLLPGLLLILLSLAPVAEAQDKKEVSIKFKTIFFQTRDKAVPVIYTGALGKREEVSLSSSRISESQKGVVRDGNKVDFFETIDAEEPIATVTLPRAGRELLFIFTPFERKIKAWAVKVPLDKFGKGSRMMVNATSGSVAVKLGSMKAVKIPSGKNAILSVSKSFKDKMIPVKIYERKAADEDWVIAQSTRWPVDRRFRSYVFVYRKPGARSLQVHGVSERLVVPE